MPFHFRRVFGTIIFAGLICLPDLNAASTPNNPSSEVQWVQLRLTFVDYNFQYGSELSFRPIGQVFNQLSHHLKRSFTALGYPRPQTDADVYIKKIRGRGFGRLSPARYELLVETPQDLASALMKWIQNPGHSGLALWHFQKFFLRGNPLVFLPLPQQAAKALWSTGTPGIRAEHGGHPRSGIALAKQVSSGVTAFAITIPPHTLAEGLVKVDHLGPCEGPLTQTLPRP